MTDNALVKNILLVLSVPPMSCSEHHIEYHHTSDYVGEESREIWEEISYQAR